MRTAAVLPVFGIMLTLANWYVRPDAAFAWAAALALFVVMLAVLGRAVVQPDAASRRGFSSIATSVVFGALILIIPLATTLASSFGIIEGTDAGRRASMVLVGVFLALTGNAMPRMLPPVSQMGCNGARMQAFQRRAGWIWTLAGLAFALAWLALPVDVAQPLSMAVTAASLVLTIVLLLQLRLRQPRRHSPLLN